jgi:hypothetical protein
MSKHTPGPWRVFTCDGGISEYHIWPIWVGCYKGGEISDSIAKIEDAHLAASAPDMLEAFEHIIIACSSVINQEGIHEDAKKLAKLVVKDCRKAILKATTIAEHSS